MELVSTKSEKIGLKLWERKITGFADRNKTAFSENRQNS